MRICPKHFTLAQVWFGSQTETELLLWNVKESLASLIGGDVFTRNLAVDSQILKFNCHIQRICFHVREVHLYDTLEFLYLPWNQKTGETVKITI
jgi:hypothetical protein